MASKDYKTPARPAAGRTGHPMLVGIVIGIVIGLATALGVALYIFKAPDPFLPRDEGVRSRTTPEAVAKAPKGAAPAAAQSQAESASPGKPASPDDAGAKPRFEFYGILAGTEKPAKDREVKPPEPTEAKLVEHYYLQVGAFQSADDADNLKAKLALAGIEAKIKTAELPDGKVWHRVRLGPFEHVAEVDRVRARLKQNQLQGALIKVQEKP